MTTVFKRIKDQTMGQILEIAEHKGEFVVHKYRYRDAPTRSKVRELSKRGLLIKAWESSDEIGYKPLKIGEVG